MVFGWTSGAPSLIASSMSSDRRQRLVLDVDALERVLRGGLGAGGDDGDGLADVVDLVDGQRRARRG